MGNFPAHHVWLADRYTLGILGSNTSSWSLELEVLWPFEAYLILNAGYVSSRPPGPSKFLSRCKETIHFCTKNRCVSLQNWGTQTDGLSFISAHISIRLSTAIWPYVPGQWFQSSHVRHIISREKATQLGKPTLEQTKTWVDYLWQNNSVIK